MPRQQIKIEFNSNPKIKVGEICEFISNDNTTKFKAVYIGSSIIHNNPIFMIQHMPIKEFTDYTLKGNSIKNVSIIRQLKDVEDSNSFISENKEKIIDYLFEVYEINESDLKEKNSYKSIIRNIKLKNII